ncbi:glycosyltransferase family 2 protein [uncultured Methanobrevibacter sp.]|uniref:glycosyltransferase family 2 protein n=1 Tax=uncultured Methanobrevibacter sp. TaxID=253161 RepID=UPI0025EC51F1|nr:glycosyltransferase family 2 protein [uncultured Methanobrevibacter sp.]
MVNNVTFFSSFMTHPYTVSVLIPVYNAKSYIGRCAESVFEQSYSDIEFVFVNDGSTDNSIEIVLSVLKKYPSRKDKVIIVDHITNRGISAARNTAIAAAHGAFVMFVDSDDWIQKDAVEQCVNKQCENDADIVSMSYVWHKKDSSQIVCETDEGSSYKILYNLLTMKSTGRIWGRLIRRRLFYDNSVHFIEGADYGEDLMVMSKLCYFSKNYAIVLEAFYNYDNRVPSSYTQMFSPEKSQKGLKNVDALCAFFKGIGDPEIFNAVQMLNALTIADHMILCSGIRETHNIEYHNNVLLKRLDSVDTKIIKQIPLRYRFICYLRSFELVHLFVKAYKAAKYIL